MSVLSIRSMPKDLERALNQEVKRSGRTKTELVISALRQMFGEDPAEKRNKQMLDFFKKNKMSKKEKQEFDERMKVFSEIDEEMWK